MGDFDALANQFSGRRFAELILEHASKQSPREVITALSALQSGLSPELKEPVVELVDFVNAMPQPQLRKFFSGDCGDKFLELMDVIKGFLISNYGLQVSRNEAFDIFNIIVLNYAAACQSFPQTNAAMRKAAGHGFLRRLLT
ncbi:hypothetical protein [Methyloligella solikamskensis]|uniref:Uncharacterized protein n=1 Tax=Methyloligella solikamskensis TaxID=1177756 RepID=A0ABW3J5L0_9HYPH